MNNLPTPSEYAGLWNLDPQTVFLNHGSFGACPATILDLQRKYQEMLEAQPVRFFMREMEALHDQSRCAVAGFVNAKPEDLVFVQNATSGVNTVFRSLKFKPGDEIIYTSHIYGACKRLLEFVAWQSGAKLVEADYSFPVNSPEVIVDTVLAKVTPKTKIALIDHISSATALIHPVETLVRELDKRGVDTMIDGAHALGSIPLDLQQIGAAYYTANCHKWLCSPKSAAILHVRQDKQKGIVPVVISHAGHTAEPFAERFFWPGTYDPAAALCVAGSIGYMNSLLPGGWTALMERNHRLCLEARELICRELQIPEPCPAAMIACMASFPLPAPESFANMDYKGIEPLQDHLFKNFSIEIPVWNWSSPPSRIIRIAVQLYNSMDQFRYLSEALKQSLETGPGK
jgi:isopenicillin-N epimerase